MTRFENIKDFESFCDKSMFCLCGRLMTGLHMRGCRKLAKERINVMNREKKETGDKK